MTEKRLSDAEILEKLNANPELRERIGCLLLAIEDEQGDLREADAAELRIIEEMRQMGQESLAAWAQRQVRKRSQEVREAEGVWREGKKNCAGTPPLAK